LNVKNVGLFSVCTLQVQAADFCLQAHSRHLVTGDFSVSTN